MRFLIFILFGFGSTFEEVLHRRFEYKHSFKGPSLTDAAMKVPFWEASGSEFSKFYLYLQLWVWNLDTQ